jgi:hypothetical protein
MIGIFITPVLFVVVDRLAAGRGALAPASGEPAPAD